MISPIKLNLGCASRPLKDFVNIDLDSIEQIKKRYPNIDIPGGIEVFNYDIFNLPYKDGTVDYIKTDSLLEHLSFLEEKQLFLEIKRVLKIDGIFEFSVPDFEETVKLWLNAKDDWKDFYRNDQDAIEQCHWFGQYSYSMDNRWGYLTASIFGPQNSEGQFHKNCYTEGKIKAIMNFLNFELDSLSRFRWKEDRDLMLMVYARKKSTTK
jgi:predicted SAM-dependent methyltransferase